MPPHPPISISTPIIIPRLARPFFSLPSSPFPPPPTQTVSATRMLPYPAPRLFELIADVDAYREFVPYCSLSRVTAWSKTRAGTERGTRAESDRGGIYDPTRQWPVRADLRVGWGGFDETYTSRLCCVPSRGIVEAISGAAESDLPEAQHSHHANTTPHTPGSAIFRSLYTRWTITPAGPASATADLRIRFQFVNPLYAAVSSAVSDRIAALMIEAFEGRARAVLGDA